MKMKDNFLILNKYFIELYIIHFGPIPLLQPLKVKVSSSKNIVRTGKSNNQKLALEHMVDVAV